MSMGPLQYEMGVEKIKVNNINKQLKTKSCSHPKESKMFQKGNINTLLFRCKINSSCLPGLPAWTVVIRGGVVSWTRPAMSASGAWTRNGGFLGRKGPGSHQKTREGVECVHRSGMIALPLTPLALFLRPALHLPCLFSFSSFSSTNERKLRFLLLSPFVYDFFNIIWVNWVSKHHARKEKSAMNARPGIIIVVFQPLLIDRFFYFFDFLKFLLNQMCVYSIGEQTYVEPRGKVP